MGVETPPLVGPPRPAMQKKCGKRGGRDSRTNVKYSAQQALTPSPPPPHKNDSPTPPYTVLASDDAPEPDEGVGVLHATADAARGLPELGSGAVTGRVAGGTEGGWAGVGAAPALVLAPTAEGACSWLYVAPTRALVPPRGDRPDTPTAVRRRGIRVGLDCMVAAVAAAATCCTGLPTLTLAVAPAEDGEPTAGTLALAVLGTPWAPGVLPGGDRRDGALMARGGAVLLGAGRLRPREEAGAAVRSGPEPPTSDPSPRSRWPSSPPLTSLLLLRDNRLLTPDRGPAGSTVVPATPNTVAGQLGPAAPPPLGLLMALPPLTSLRGPLCSPAITELPVPPSRPRNCTAASRRGTNEYGASGWCTSAVPCAASRPKNWTAPSLPGTKEYGFSSRCRGLVGAAPRGFRVGTRAAEMGSREAPARPPLQASPSASPSLLALGLPTLLSLPLPLPEEDGDPALLTWSPSSSPSSSSASEKSPAATCKGVRVGTGADVARPIRGADDGLEDTLRPHEPHPFTSSSQKKSDQTSKGTHVETQGAILPPPPRPFLTCTHTCCCGVREATHYAQWKPHVENLECTGCRATLHSCTSPPLFNLP